MVRAASAVYALSTDSDTRFMRRALRLARKGLGRTTPNPAVGSVVVRDGVVVGEGWHRRAGEAHAEVIALERAGERARGATLYSTLEPCVHDGRTPPCAEAVLRAGVARVVAATRDPDPRVDGRGVERLRAAGLDVAEGILGQEARALNRAFFKHVRTRLPYVLLKLGLSLDAKVAAPDRRYLTGPESLRHVHRLRDEHDAVMVGIGTVLADDPLLTVREIRGRDPLRVVIDADARTPPAARVVGRDGRALVVVGDGADSVRVSRLRDAGAQVLEAPRGAGGVDLGAAMRLLGARDVTSVLLEGGPTLAAAMLDAALVDELLLIYAPLVVGDPAPSAVGALRRVSALRLRDVRVFRLGEDVAVSATLPPD